MYDVGHVVRALGLLGIGLRPEYDNTWKGVDKLIVFRMKMALSGKPRSPEGAIVLQEPAPTTTKTPTTFMALRQIVQTITEDNTRKVIIGQVRKQEKHQRQLSKNAKLKSETANLKEDNKKLLELSKYVKVEDNRVRLCLQTSSMYRLAVKCTAGYIGTQAVLKILDQSIHRNTGVSCEKLLHGSFWARSRMFYRQLYERLAESFRLAPGSGHQDHPPQMLLLLIISLHTPPLPHTHTPHDSCSSCSCPAAPGCPISSPDLLGL
eukprot:364192-Pyramimonas_sp.AAC.1